LNSTDVPEDQSPRPPPRCARAATPVRTPVRTPDRHPRGLRYFLTHLGPTAARLDQVPALEAAAKVSADEAAASKKTISGLNDRISRLELRLPSADKYDAQVKAAEAQAESDAKEADAAAATAKLQTKRDNLVKYYQPLVAADDEKTAKENAYDEHLRGTPGGYETAAKRWGSVNPPCDSYLDHQRDLATRAHNRLGLSYATRLASGEITQEQFEQMEETRTGKLRAKGLLNEVTEDHRRANDPNAEIDPTFANDITGRNDIWRDLDGKPVR
jgi:hypothetical protein